MKFFNLDFHISVIEDVKNIINKLYPAIEIVDWPIGEHYWIMQKKQAQVEFINKYTWLSSNFNKDLIKAFQDKYDSFLSTFDGFIVTHTPIFSLLFEKYNKPIILVNSCRYEQPYCWVHNKEMLDHLEERLKAMYYKKQLIPIANNQADMKYLKMGTGIESQHIPSLCLYTKAAYTGLRNIFIIKGPRILHRIKNAVYLEDILPKAYKWEQLYSFKGIIHIPYEMSTMSIFEQYSANIPLVFPTKTLLKKLLYANQIPFNGPYIRYNNVPLSYKDNIIKTREATGEKWIEFWVDNADYYDEENMKYITYFDSFEELPKVLESMNTTLISKQMKEWNEKRKEQVYSKWDKIIREYFL